MILKLNTRAIEITNRALARLAKIDAMREEIGGMLDALRGIHGLPAEIIEHADYITEEMGEGRTDHRDDFEAILAHLNGERHWLHKAEDKETTATPQPNDGSLDAAVTWLYSSPR